MNQSEKIAREANQKLLEWSKDQPKLVVTIDGYTGVGKTTLSDNLVKLNPEILAAHYDDFLLSSREIKEKMVAAGTDQREDVIHHDFEKIKGLTDAFRSGSGVYETKIFNPETKEMDIPIRYDFVGKKILLMDGVFMFHPERLDPLWDKRIYLDGEIPKIDERRVAREKARWGARYHPETEPNSHFAQLTRALKLYRQEHQPEKLADLVLWVD